MNDYNCDPFVNGKVSDEYSDYLRKLTSISELNNVEIRIGNKFFFLTDLLVASINPVDGGGFKEVPCFIYHC